MAVFVNTKNVISHCFAVNDEIKLLLTLPLSDISEVFHSVLCPSVKNCEDSSVKSKSNNDHYVVSIAVSNDGNFLAASDSQNFLHVWKKEENSYIHVSSRSHSRKSQRIIFTNKGSELILADRGGDVYSYSVYDKSEQNKFLLGHISLVIDIAMSSDDKFLLTSDRDGKVRVSHYPNCYNIHSYCLGHQEFVSSVQCVELDKELILSSSGDGSIKLWDFLGKEILCLKLYESEEIVTKVEKCELLCKYTSDGESESLPYILDEKQINCAVKNIRYSLKNHLLVMHFYFIKGIAVYYLDKKHNSCFKFVQFISLPSVPYDLFFDSSSNLVVLVPNDDKKLMYFTVDNGDKLALVLNNSYSSPVFSSYFQEMFEKVSKVFTNQSDYEILFKRQYESEDKNKTLEEADTLKKIKCS